MDPSSFRLVHAFVFPGFELLDLFGPLELLGVLPENFSIRLVSLGKGPIRSAQGPRVHPDADLIGLGACDLLLVPGGIGIRTLVEDPATIDAIVAKARISREVASVCTGSALLAKAGLLDGRKATSNKRVFDWVTTQGPRVEWIRRARWVEDGNRWTASGVSAGMDMTLSWIEKRAGRDAAIEAATEAEYVRQEDPSDDPFCPPN